VANKAALRREGEALVLTGALDRTAVTALWLQASAALAGVRTLDLRAVERVDSAGVALLAELAARLRAAGEGQPQVLGAPAGLAELTAAYRLTPSLDFQVSPPPAAS
jgi:phospholipid transport system transporter-binding protein